VAILNKRVTVIGGGPGGYVAAIRAAQLGAAVTIVEKNRFGGTCLNVGCIPTKALLHSAELYTTMKRDASSVGIFADNLRFDWPLIVKRKNDIVNHLVGGVSGLLHSNGIERIMGEAHLISPNTVKADDKLIEADAVIIATGSEPAMPPIPGLDSSLDGIVTSEGALSFETLPHSIVIIGGGVIGVEFASIFASFGVTVTIVEMLPRILTNVDAEIADILRRSLESRGVTFYTGARLKSVARSAHILTLNVTTETRAVDLTADKLLISTGRRPYTKNLGLEPLGIATERGRILVNERMETSVKNIYAIGDCASQIMLAHVASREGEVAAENIMGHEITMDYKTVPSAIYTSPAVASVGLSEDEARKAGHQVRVGRFPLMANGKSVVTGDTNGMVKIVSDDRYGEILGIHVVGGPAIDMIGEAGLALRLEATLDEIISTIHAHPTVGEALGEAALASWGRAIHLPKPKVM